jgi:hypothetical protein
MRWILALLCIAACGTEAAGVDACRQVEEARCDRMVDCQIPYSRPHHGGDVEACKRFYRDACLHGLVNGTPPGDLLLAACVEKIRTTTDCEIVKVPEKASECSWLIPSAPAPEAGAETSGDAGDGG